MENELKQVERDALSICEAAFIPWEALRGRRILVTGATGLIGHTLIYALAAANLRKGLGLTILALVRDEARARQRFESLEGKEALEFVCGTVEELPRIDGPVHYIVHGASQTSSKMFVERPVETIITALRGTENLLELAREKKTEGFVYLSSMEVYGFPEKGRKVTEDDIGALSPLDMRNSYPISKVQCESLCCAYAREYGVPAKVLRLTQTFGPGVNYVDQRIFAQIGRCVMEKRDIVLRTRGATERSYLYTADAATAILAVLLLGQPGSAYNAADESTYCSIADMARRIAEKNGIRVRFELADEKALGYPKTLYMDLDTGRLRGLGWAPGGGSAMSLEDMYENMMFSWKEHGVFHG